MIRRHLSPLALGVVVGAVAFMLVAVRLVGVADRDISQFVVAGSIYTYPDQVDPPIHVIPDSGGYDGQFYWRLAASPTELHIDRERGVQFDANFRVTRIAYPMIAWAISVGQAEWVKWSLVITNILGMGVIAMSGASLARSRGRPTTEGLVLASSSGLLMTLSRDLCEITMIGALTAGIAAMARRSYALAAACWAIACLAHEQALFCVVPYAAYRAFSKIRHREWRPTGPDAVWMVSLAAFGGWQLFCRSFLGEFPVLSVKGAMDIPFRGLFNQLKDWLLNGIGPVEAIVLPQLALLGTLVVLAFRSIKTLAEEDRWLGWSLVGATAACVSLSHFIWDGPADLRQLVILSTVAWLVIVTSGRKIPMMLVGATAVVWILTAAGRMAAI